MVLHDESVLWVDEQLRLEGGLTVCKVVPAPLAAEAGKVRDGKENVTAWG